MNSIIALGSIRPTGEEMVYVQASDLSPATIFKLDRVLRQVVKMRPYAEWHEFLDALEQDGFSSVVPPTDSPVYVHSRAWDEHLVCYGQSFFVEFPHMAPYELANRTLLASSYPQMYAAINHDYLDESKVILLNAEHEPVYSDDLAWATEDRLEQMPIGPALLIREQFVDDADFQAAKNVLVYSGYQVLDVAR